MATFGVSADRPAEAPEVGVPVFQVFWCLGVGVWAFGRSGVDDIWEGHRGDQGGHLKMAKIHYWGKTGHH